MAKSNSKRKTRSDKFPLTLHPTGQYCKKIKLKLRDFLVSFSAINPCEARNRHLLLQSGLPTNGTKENLDYPVAVD